MSKYQSPRTLLWRRAQKKLQTCGSFFSKYGLRALVFILSFLIITWAVIGVLRALSGPNWTISEVEVQIDGKGKLYDHQDLLKYLEKDFKDVNRVVAYGYRRRFFSYYEKQLPWIQNMRMKVDNGIAYITVEGRAPLLYIQSQNRYFAFANNRLISVQKIISVPSTGSVTIPQIELTGMISSGNGLTWLFYGMDGVRLVKQLQLIVDNISDFKKLYYIPGARKVIMLMNTWHELYFDLQKNIIAQLDKYHLLLTDWASLKWYRKIDVGTMDDMVFLGK